MLWSNFILAHLWRRIIAISQDCDAPVLVNLERHVAEPDNAAAIAASDPGHYSIGAWREVLPDPKVLASVSAQVADCASGWPNLPLPWKYPEKPVLLEQIGRESDVRLRTGAPNCGSRPKLCNGRGVLTITGDAASWSSLLTQTGRVHIGDWAVFSVKKWVSGPP